MRIRSLAAMLAIGLTAVVAAQNANRTVSFEVREGTRLVFDVSPDDSTIAFDLLGQLWTMPAIGGTATPLTDAARDRAEDGEPAFSPDGRWIAFRSSRSGGRGLFVIPVSGGPVRRVTTGADEMPDWSPDSRRLIFMRGNALQIVDVDTGAVSRVDVEGLKPPVMRDPHWSRDGAQLLFVNGASPFSGGPLVRVSANGGTTTTVATGGRQALAPAYAPDGASMAYFSRGTDGRGHLWVQGDGEARQLTDHADTTTRHVHWSRDGMALTYSADGKMWRVPVAGGVPTAIPFTARVSLQRPTTTFAPVRFHAPGTRVPARGHMGLALSPDGKSIGIIALGQLWVFAPGTEPRPLVAVPHTAGGVAWSPNSQQIAWSAGSQGTEDIFVTDVATKHTRKLTALPGQEVRAAWSPDGQWLAFVHWQKAVLETPPSRPDDSFARLRAVRIQSAHVDRLEETRDLGELPLGWMTTFFPNSQDIPQWAPDSEAVLGFDGQRGWLKTLDGATRNLARFPQSAAFVRWRADGSLLFIAGNSLRSAIVRPGEGMVGEPIALGDDAALYPSVSNDGTVLYISGDGLRLRSATGAVRALGWPLKFTTPRHNEALLIRNARVIDGTGTPASPPRDILVEGGRVVRITERGGAGPAAARVLDAGGRFVMPGLIDLHAHVWDDLLLPGWLAHGVTTVRDTGAAVGRLVALRDAIDAGTRLGPRIVAGGFQFGPADRVGITGDIIQLPADRDEVKRAMSLVRGFGNAYVKMRIPSSIPSGAALVEEARAAGLRVSGHIASPLAYISAGIAGKEHLGQAGDRADETVYDDLVQLTRESRLWVVPTTVAFATAVQLMDTPALIDAPDIAPFLSPFMRWWARRLPATSRATYARLARDARDSTRRYVQAGITLGAGADAPMVPSALHGEVEELVAAGLSPSMAIASATGIAAAILGADGEIGTVTRGKRADLVIVDRDPTADIRNTRTIWRVVKDGVVHEPSAVAGHAKDVAALPK